jgi:hypothetical protein
MDLRDSVSCGSEKGAFCSPELSNTEVKNA